MNGLQDTFRLSKKLQNRGEERPTLLNPIQISEYIEPTNIGGRKRGRRKNKLTTDEKISIVHKVIYQLLPVKDVALEFRITQAYVCNLVSKTKKNPKFLGDMIDKKEQLALEEVKVREAVTECLHKDGYLSCINDIKDMLEKDHGLSIKPWRLLKLVHE